MPVGEVSIQPLKKDSRRLSAEWQLSDKVFVVLSAYHNKDRKAFHAVLQQETVERYEGYTTRSFTVFSGVSVGAERVDRYSAKALQEFFDGMLTYVEAERSLDGKIAEQFVLDA